MPVRWPRSTRRLWSSLAILLVASAILWTLVFWDNFGVVRPDDIYRSAQLSGPGLARRVRENRVKTVLNLRGSHPESAWYRNERAATLDAGATQIDIPLSSCEWMSRTQAKALLDVLETAERPILIHCFHGSERTAMASAFAVLLEPDSRLEDADAQFTAFHLYFGLGDGIVTQQHLGRYEAWLKDGSLEHSPERLRRWLSCEYRPESPNREEWDHDPYPLVVVSRPVRRIADRR